MATRTGSSFGITAVIGSRLFDVNDVASLDLVIPMCKLPYGKIEFKVHDAPDFKVESGKFGTIIFLNTGNPALDGTGFSIVVREASYKEVSESTLQVKVRFEAASETTLKCTTGPVTGSSLDAMVDILKSYGDELKYTNLITGDLANSFTDNMQWQNINNNLPEKLNGIVNHSSMNGDWLFWAFDETTSSFLISSLGNAKDVGVPQALIYSQNALGPTESIVYKDSNTGSTFWLFNISERLNDAGNNLESMFPNIVFSTVSKGKADISNCNGECFSKVVYKYGAMPAEKAAEQFGVSPNIVIGETDLVTSYAVNVHKTYSIADVIRSRILAEYGKKLCVGLLNSMGPPIGSRVYVRILKPTAGNAADAVLDQYYTDSYIVASKKYSKRETLSGGVLGGMVGDQNADYITTLVLISNHPGNSEFNNTVEELGKIAQACNENAKK